MYMRVIVSTYVVCSSIQKVANKDIVFVSQVDALHTKGSEKHFPNIRKMKNTHIATQIGKQLQQYNSLRA